MSLPRASLSSFLSSAKTALNSALNSGGKVNFVVGNESADLDSLCSAILLAYLRTYSPLNHSKSLYIPLSNLPRADLGLRPELHPVLKKARVKVGELISLDDLREHGTKSSQVTKLKPDDTRWILVDHNALQGELGRIYGGGVRGCIDHHDEEGKVPEKEICEGEGEMRIVEKSGSCASLVVAWAREGWAEMKRGDGVDGDVRQWDGELAYLALGPILIDTNNLQSADKTCESDLAAVQFLEELITKDPNTSQSPWNQDEYFSTITAAKEDIGNMELRDILRKDYKEWYEGGLNLGISAVVQGFDFLLAKAGSRDLLLEVLGEWAKERSLDICAVMTTSNKEGVFRRELLVWGLGNRGVECLRKFKGEGESRFGLKIWGQGILNVDEEKEIRHCWWQERIEHSRKQVAPLLRQSML
ncbi:uncharacterized protein EAF01_006326 [Botrytis porri]|uniref:DHHA2 domain-containing protein n=1 Tax=Botrytis porri TaxID=87229 RepID=A0A4Z1L319_9HELO|nr:uncharacterized protein EAF01_006326 [Botrytis porri]KAF7903277.1 hypothetical protein EAF01_006326 [Botrytis porri]TGO91232.1 hypothetical protein BPOR_0035g00330 [Botrytis porri]